MGLANIFSGIGNLFGSVAKVGEGLPVVGGLVKQGEDALGGVKNSIGAVADATGANGGTGSVATFKQDNDNNKQASSNGAGQPNAQFGQAAKAGEGDSGAAISQGKPASTMAANAEESEALEAMLI
jgi:hypothetical protein